MSHTEEGRKEGKRKGRGKKKRTQVASTVALIVEWSWIFQS